VSSRFSRIRRASSAALVCVSLAASASAQSASADPQAPDASTDNTPRSWLAQRGARTSSDAASPTKSSPTLSRTLLGLLLLASVIGGAVYVRRRRLTASVASPAIKLEVLASTRISPKAHAVVASVGGRVMLLGVTDQSVRRLAWISPRRLERRAEPKTDRARETAEPEHPLRAAIDEQPVRTPAAPAKPAAAPKTNEKPFRELLTRALGRSNDPAPAAADSALLIAETTRDHFERRSAPANEAREARFVEGQAAGLSARRRGTA
jgi:flagellar biogenesis protein FliO